VLFNFDITTLSVWKQAAHPNALFPYVRGARVWCVFTWCRMQALRDLPKNLWCLRSAVVFTQLVAVRQCSRSVFNDVGVLNYHNLHVQPFGCYVRALCTILSFHAVRCASTPNTFTKCALNAVHISSNASLCIAYILVRRENACGTVFQTCDASSQA